MEKKVYPIVLTKDTEGYLVHVPGFDIDTFGKDEVDAVEMAKDAIGLMGTYYEDKGKELPKYDYKAAEESKETEDDIIALVDVDFELYRMKNDNRKVRKNVTIPFYLNKKAEELGLNFSRTLEEALIAKTSI